jgi:hypothetical protein
MRIYGRKKCAFMEKNDAHLWKLSSVYVHFSFCICAFTEENMCIYGNSIPYIEIPYMHIYRSQNVHIQKIECAYTKDRCQCLWEKVFMFNNFQRNRKK